MTVSKKTHKTIRQEQLREYFSKQRTGQEIMKIIERLQDLKQPLEKDEIARLEKAMNGHFRVLGKFLPDLKATELTGKDGEELRCNVSAFLFNGVKPDFDADTD